MDTKIENRKSYIYVEITGHEEVKMAEFRRVALSVLGVAREQQISKILINAKSLLTRPSTIERYYFAESLARENTRGILNKLPPMQVALVALPSVIDPDKFGEKVARNRGLNALVTSSLEEALEWLGENAPGPESAGSKLSLSPMSIY